MAHPRYRYLFVLSERYSKPVSWVKNSITAKEMHEQMAFDLTKDQTWLEQYYKEKELERSRQLSAEEQSAQIRKMFGV